MSHPTFLRLAAATAGLVTAVSGFALSAHAAGLTPTQINAIVSLVASFGADAHTIANVQAALTGTAPAASGGGTITYPSPSGSSSGPNVITGCAFLRALAIGARGSDVTCLQAWLISHGYPISAGATGYYGVQTQAAVDSWHRVGGTSVSASGSGSVSASVSSSDSLFTSADSQLAALNSDMGSIDDSISQNDDDN